MSDLISSSDYCLVGDHLEGSCKKKIFYEADKTKYFRYYILLNVKAWCKIRKPSKEIDQILMRRLKTAFKEIKTDFLATIDVVAGAPLKCDNCEKPDIPNNVHNGQDLQAPIKIRRIKDYPVVCFIDDSVSSPAYVEALNKEQKDLK